MRHYSYIRLLMAALMLPLVFSCISKEVTYETSGSELSIAPVASVVTKSNPGAITGTTYPQNETMGVFAFHNAAAAPGAWENTTDVESYVYYKDASDTQVLNDDKPMAAEFGYREDKGAWGGIFSTLSTDGKSTTKQEQPHRWPEEGSLIFAGFSPYYKFNSVDADKLGTLRPMKELVSFDVSKRELKITNYTVGQYIPMTAEQIEDPDDDYVNDSQSDLMFFMPQVEDGKYMGVNKLSAYPARFYHALSLVEFRVRAEDDYDVDRLDIDRIALEEVYHTGDFTARVEDDGKITAGWTNLKGQSAINIFGEKEAGTNVATDLHIDMQPRSVAQLLIIPGETHKIKVVCHVYTMNKYYEQVYVIEPKDVGIEKWEVGKRYVYNLILGLNKITFAPETYDWNDVDGGGYSEPANE